MNNTKRSHSSLNWVLFFLTLIIISACEKNPSQDCFDTGPMDSAPRLPYDDPVCHPSGDIIGFNHIPLKKITYTDNGNCPPTITYTYDNDLKGFWLVDKDGSNMRRVLPYFLYTPAWSPDGNWIAFSNGAQIKRMRFDGVNFDTSTIEQLTNDGSNFFPAWDYSGTRIAFNQSACGDVDCGVWSLDMDANSLEFIGQYGSYPTWHPIQDKILYVTNDLQDGNDVGDIFWAYNFNDNTTTLVKNLSSPNIDNILLSYSPDGSLITFISILNTGDGFQLFSVNPDGSNLIQQTTLGAYNFSYFPDGKIVFVQYDSSEPLSITNGTMWIMDADGSNKTQLTYNIY